MTNYIYLLFGSKDIFYVEAAYSIGTLLRRIDRRSSRIIVFTDQPERIKTWPVICEPIADDLEAMQSPTRYIHRPKMCVILRCLERYSGNVVYFDSDTFVSGNLEALSQKLDRGTAIMNLFEGKNPVPELAGFHTTLSGNQDYSYSRDSVMYNSGVVGLHQDHRQLVAHALELCDALQAVVPHVRTVEQFAISEMLRLADARVLSSRGVAVHYIKAKHYVRPQIFKMMAETGKQPWEFDRSIPYWYPAIKVMKFFGKYTS